MTFSIRKAVEDSPTYPFKPLDAPIKLDQNESPEDFPAELKAEVLHRLSTSPWNRYPDLNAEQLCQAISAYEGWPEAGVVVTTGSNVLISLLAQVAGIGQRVLTVKPSFALYTLDAQLLGASQVTEVPLLEDLSVDIAGLRAAIADAESTSQGQPGVIYLAQPQAPTGGGLSMEALRALADISQQWLLILDEAYAHFSDSDCRGLAADYPHIVILRTFSKSWGLAGLRLGYALTSADVARNLKKLAPPFAVSVMQTVAAQVALSHPQYMTSRAAGIIEERERVYQALRSHPTWKVFPSKTNFLLIRTPDAKKAFEGLLAQGVLVRRQDSYHGLHGCIRVTIGAPHENKAFVTAALALR